jgi:hypothetical protein
MTVNLVNLTVIVLRLGALWQFMSTTVTLLSMASLYRGQLTKTVSVSELVFVLALPPLLYALLFIYAMPVAGWWPAKSSRTSPSAA